MRGSWIFSWHKDFPIHTDKFSDRWVTWRKRGILRPHLKPVVSNKRPCDVFQNRGIAGFPSKYLYSLFFYSFERPLFLSYGPFDQAGEQYAPNASWISMRQIKVCFSVQCFPTVYWLQWIDAIPAVDRTVFRNMSNAKRVDERPRDLHVISTLKLKKKTF